jgi:peptidyl-prolyl cis-trans isomerase B (cyclophilin B)
MVPTIISPYGIMELELYESETPNTVENFLKLIREGFYTDLSFHRVIREFVVQGGCPNGDGTGGPGYAIKCELEGEKQYHDKGVLSMAHAGKDTGGSQFFMCYNRHHAKHLDGKHTCFGKIIKGVDLLLQIKEGDKFSIIIK